MLLQNTGIHLQDYTVSQPRRPQSEYSSSYFTDTMALQLRNLMMLEVNAL
jgi:hypothetical protein